MKTIVFLGTHKSDSSREAIKAAEQLGFFTCLLTDNPRQLKQREEYYDVHLMIYCNLNDIDNIRFHLNQIQKRSLTIKAIISFIDPYCALASKLSEEYNVPTFTSKALAIMENKLNSRECLKDTPYIPNFKIIKGNQINDCPLSLPAILKYIDSNGSKDVFLCKDQEDFQNKYHLLLTKYPDGTFLIEEYLVGPQYLIELLVMNKEILVVAVIKQEITYTNDHFIVTGYQLLLDLEEEFVESLMVALTTIIKCHGLENGPSHLEMRLVNNQWKLIEINPRISGAGMNRLIKYGYGINLVKETLKLALKKPIYLTPIYKRHTYAHYLTVEQGGKLFKITGKQQAIMSPGVKYLHIKPKKGSILIPPISMGHRYAYLIANGPTSETAKRNALNAASKINFHFFKNEQKKEIGQLCGINLLLIFIP